MPTPPPIRLYMFEGSNACLTAQLMLEHKQLPYDRIDLPPAAHAFLIRRRGFPKTVPAMILGGKHVQRTLDISEALDVAFPANPSCPSRTRVRSE